MILRAAHVAVSAIHGKGLFLGEPVARSTVVINMAIDANFVSESEYLAALQAGEPAYNVSGVRWVDDVFLVSSVGEEDEDFINHAFTPSLIYHCGLCFAARDLQPGEELTVDYRLWLSDSPLDDFTDASTARLVRGWSAQEALKISTTQLAELFARGDQR